MGIRIPSFPKMILSAVAVYQVGNSGIIAGLADGIELPTIAAPVNFTDDHRSFSRVVLGQVVVCDEMCIRDRVKTSSVPA